MPKEIVARDFENSPGNFAETVFSFTLRCNSNMDALYLDSTFTYVLAVSGLLFKAPVTLELLKNPVVLRDILQETKDRESILIKYDRVRHTIEIWKANGSMITISPEGTQAVVEILQDAEQWAGHLNAQGEHVVDLRSPSPGPHFSVNLLIGNRMGFAHALQTTPKSVVDKLGGGSFRSHAATQVLATRWDMRQEENGFPANRQFYLTEDNQKIFYSADPLDKNITEATCTHGRNYTKLIYKTECGLEIRRLIFILPQKQGLPLAVETQRIEVVNHSGRKRNLRLVYTGMFGNCTPMSQMEDVLYANIIMQSRLLLNKDGSIQAVGIDYSTLENKSDQWFHVMLSNDESRAVFPKEFCMNYNEFVGAGTLQSPQNLMRLSNNSSRKGPGFFAVAMELSLSDGQMRKVDNFTGMVSNKDNPNYQYTASYQDEIRALVERYSKDGELEKAFDFSTHFLDQFSNYLQLETSDKQMELYINRNLPFQILYQTLASRSFCQTQKGYREIGFREIQDIYASMYYYCAIGKTDFVKQLLLEWCSMVFEFGFAYHNFFWVGKEPGVWSDDALWFIQAVHRYISLTGDIGLLDEPCTIAGSNGKTRRVYDTIKAILRYSSQISVGKHGFPTLDYADWNDCLKVDSDFINGITKEKLYKEQVAVSGNDGEPFKNNFSESIMNAFLLKIALDQTAELATQVNDLDYQQLLQQTSCDLTDRLQQFAWKNDYFARVLINRDTANHYSYIGARGDGFSSDPKIDGVFFLNSFSWSVLSGAATEKQIGTMFDIVGRYLRTPYGLKLVSPSDLSPVTRASATEEYFPGDRENGGVFKHACMMATRAMFKAAKEVKSTELAKQLAQTAYWMIDIVLPFRTMISPFEICGNPRFCTQYNNSETGENVGPMLSGTATWLFLSLIEAYGVEYLSTGIRINPVLREEQTELSYVLNTGKSKYAVHIKKEARFKRIMDCKAVTILDGAEMDSNLIPMLSDGKTHKVDITII